MSWWRGSEADRLQEQIRVEQMREEHARLKAANDARDKAAATVEKAQREQEEQAFRRAWIKPWPHSPAFPAKREDKVETRFAKWVLSTALEDARLREVDRKRERTRRAFMDEVHARTGTSANARDTGQARERRRDDHGRGR
jgi:hypothetical protein